MWPLYRFRFRISPVTFHFHLLRQIYKYEIINTKPFFPIRSSNSFNFSLRLRRFVLPRLTNWFKLRSIASTYFSIMPRKSRANNGSGEETASKNTPQMKIKTNESGKRKGTDQEDTPNPKRPMLNKVDSDLTNLCVTCNTKTADGKSSNFKIASWNVAGIRACIKKNGIEYVMKELPDVLCVQEVKCSESKLPSEVEIEGYHAYWCLGSKEGYAGVGLYSKIKPLNVVNGIDKPEYDSEGRVITAEYEDFFLINTYVPNAGAGLKNLTRRIQWDIDFRNYLKSLDEKKPIILCGDLNVSHQPIDLANPKTNTKSAGFTQEERDGLTALLEEGFVDSYRHLYPEKTGAYTYWTYLGNARSRNVGWRLDYFIVSKRFMDNLCDNVIRTEVYGSDHCPIVLFLNIPTLEK